MEAQPSDHLFRFGLFMPPEDALKAEGFAPFDESSFQQDIENALANPEPEDFSWMAEEGAEPDPELDEPEPDLAEFASENQALLEELSQYNGENPADFAVDDPLLELMAGSAVPEDEDAAPAPWDNADLWSGDDDEDMEPVPIVSLDEPEPATVEIDPGLADLISEIAKPVTDDELSTLLSKAADAGFSGGEKAPEPEPAAVAPAEAVDEVFASHVALLACQTTGPDGQTRIHAPEASLAALREANPEAEVEAADATEVARMIRQTYARRDWRLCREALREPVEEPSIAAKIWSWMRT